MASTVRKDFVIEKGARFYQEFQLFKDETNARTLVGYEIKCIIKESYETATKLFELTEANGGIVVVDDPEAEFAMHIPADETNVDVDYGVYTLVEIYEAYPGHDDKRLMEGKIKFTKGTNY